MAVATYVLRSFLGLDTGHCGGYILCVGMNTYEEFVDGYLGT